MIRVLLVDDQALVRSGFRVILETQPDIEVVGEASNGAEAVRLAASLAPDVICMDVEMPVMNGIEAARLILAPRPASAEAPPSSRGSVLVLTTFGHEEYLFDALAAGVSGFLLKTSRAEQLIDAVRTIAGGDALLGPDVTRAVMQRAAEAAARVAAASGGGDGGAADEGPGAVSGRSGAAGISAGTAQDEAVGAVCSVEAMDAAGLTEREREVLALVAAGRSNGEIAAELFLGEATVKTHVSNLLQKIGVRDRVQLVVWAHTTGA